MLWLLLEKVASPSSVVIIFVAFCSLMLVKPCLHTVTSEKDFFVCVLLFVLFVDLTLTLRIPCRRLPGTGTTPTSCQSWVAPWGVP